MPATLFLTPLSTLPNTIHHLPSHSNPPFHSYNPISSALNSKPPQNPKPTNPIPSKSPNSLSLSSTTTTPNSKAPSEPNSSTDACIKAPTAPWMKGPLLLQPHEVIDFSKPRNKKTHNNAKAEKPDTVLAGKLVGIRGDRAIKQIVQSIERLGPNQKTDETQKGFGEFRIWDSLEGLGQNEKWDETHKDFVEFGIGGCLEGLGKAADSRFGGKMPWERDERIVFQRIKKKRVASAAELSLEKELLERLRAEAAKMRKWVKVKKAGVTQAIVDDIKFIWKTNELAMVKFDVPLCRNMHRAQEIVETKTGGMVVWRKKDTLVIYRGCNYQSSSKFFPKMRPCSADRQETLSSDHVQPDLEESSSYQYKSFESPVDEKMSRKDAEEDCIQSGTFQETSMSCQPTSRSLYEKEADRLLDGLGPRFIDWWMHKPLPVDADLLPEVVPGFKAPIRRCPPHTRSKLTDDELTFLRKFARSLPTHFVLGRNRKLQGLAAAILKLWEKSLIAKIAVKFGVPNTNNEQMAYELKCLTGGVLILRNKFIILLYRGKDFLPCGVADLVAKREVELTRWQLYEEHARQKAIETFCESGEPLVNTVGTLSEFQDIQTEYGELIKENKNVEIKLEAEKERLERELRNQERKFFILNKKIEKSTNELSKLNSQRTPAEQDVDQEMMTEEEKECLRTIGLKMHSCLVLGRRGVFNGVMEGLHQHWKHREVVKVITMQKLFRQVMHTAKLLEAESGGILVSVDKLKEGHAVIIYRGKNYRRPLRPTGGNLLSKRKALHRSLEMQRIGSLKFFASQRQQATLDLKLKLILLEKPRISLEEFPWFEGYLPAFLSPYSWMVD
ncbi:chloroplastic group IIA intron splicing facilitator CRS1, chloroplastic isoform X4 [Prunus dulcis]|uniref:chloroplastic group IIA intron splicing facilitator CRS1, chloroplastic isoform X4 n=1 Tax=Prunus dulcis TaxID=3755 RepID=UPI0014830BD1|nr:chloroplastic group IIA intron splicing facilitator CRS1, chloroplastic isoform X4 [Prunus dulcis]